MKNMFALLFFFLQIPLAPNLKVEAALVQKLPKCALADGLPYYSGDTIAVNSGCEGAAHFAAEATGYAVRAESGDLAGKLAAFTDATADNSSAIRIPAGQGYGFLSGQARYLTPVLGAGDHYAWVRMRTPDPGATKVWMSTAPILLNPSPSASLRTSVGAQTLTYAWVALSNVVAGGAAREIFITTEPGVELDCIYLDALPNPPPSSIRCPGGTSAAGAEYVMLRTTGTPASCADVSTANPVPFTGFTNWNNTVVTAKLVWADASPDRIYGCIKINDTNLNAPTTGADNSALLGNNNDYFELVIKSNIDNLDDTTKTKIAINIAATPSIADIRFTAGNGSDYTYNANCSVVRTIVGDLDAVADDTSWEIFFACDLNANDIAQSQLGKINILIRDNDGVTGTGTKTLAKGGEFDINVAASMMTVLFDSNTIPPPADVTAPTVGTPTLLVNATTQQTWRFTCADAGSGCASGVLDWDINSGVPYAQSTVATLAGGNYDVTITGLTANTPYFVRGRACDVAGNCTNGAEANALTSASAVTAYVDNVALGNCSTLATACLLSTALAAAVPGSRIQLAAGTVTVPKVYTGANSMLTPPAGKSGTQASPITVVCAIAGACLINGQNLAGNRPLGLRNNNDWWRIDGINFANGGNDGGSSKTMSIAGGSDNNKISRYATWSNQFTQPFDNNGPGVIVYQSTNNTLEDCFHFGASRKVIENSQHGDFTKIRRCVGIYNGLNDPGPKDVAEQNYSATNNQYENIISLWDIVPACASLSDCRVQTFTMLGSGGIKSPPFPSTPASYCANSNFIASFAIIRANFGLPTGGGIDRAMSGDRSMDCMHFKDIVLFRDHVNNDTGKQSIRGFEFKEWDKTAATTAACFSGPSCDRTMTSITHIGNWSNAQVNTTVPCVGNLCGWQVNDVQPTANGASYATVTAANTATAMPFRATRASGIGAWTCKEVVDKVETATPLFPWRMEQQIKNMLNYANSIGDHPRNAAFYFGATGTITGMMEEIFGTIPSACKS